MKIQIIGASGTGKSTLAKHIGTQAKIKVIDTDHYLWADEFFMLQHPVSVRLEMYKNDTKDGADYVVAGSTFLWDKTGFINRELLVFLCLDEAIRMERLRKREIERFGAAAFEYDADGLRTNAFIEWCKTYLIADESEISSFANHMLQLRLATCPHIILDSNQPVEVLANEVLRNFKMR